MDRKLLQVCVTTINELRTIPPQDWHSRLHGQQLSWACGALQALLDGSFGTGKDNVSYSDLDEDDRQAMFVEVRPELAIARRLLATGYEHLIGKEADFLLDCGEKASGVVHSIEGSIIHLVDELGLSLTIDAAYVAGTVTNKADAAKNE